MWKLSSLLLLMIFTLLACTTSQPAKNNELAQEQVKAKQPKQQQKVVRLQISGMSCTQCPDNVTRILQSCEGVEKVEIDNKNQIAYVKGKPSIREEELVFALDISGRYSGVVLDE